MVPVLIRLSGHQGCQSIQHLIVDQHRSRNQKTHQHHSPNHAVFSSRSKLDAGLIESGSNFPRDIAIRMGYWQNSAALSHHAV
jgi:hypothetical protein